jgi:hypothetical protein
MGYLGDTLDGQSYTGRVFSRESVYSKQFIDYGNVLLAEQAKSDSDTRHEEMEKTINLIRESLASEELNPRSDRQIPESLL